MQLEKTTQMKSAYLFAFACLFQLMLYCQSDKTQILVLGTSHLANIDGIERSMLNTIINKLDSLNFDVIGIEKMSGELLNDIRSRQDPAFDDITKDGFGARFIKIADTVWLERNTSFLEAEKNIQTILSKGKSINEQDRLDLIFDYLAITDLPSAVLQFTYLNDNTKFHTQFEKYILQLLEKELKRNNEYYSLAMPLAIRENLNQLFPIDNFQDESLLFKYYPDFMNDVNANSELFSKINGLPVFQKVNQLTKSSIAKGDLLELYTFLNSNDYKRDDFNAQWKIWLDTNFESGADKARFYLWEMRNLSITSNILNLIARNPNKRILIIIGASHVGFLEKYLKQIDTIELLKFE